MSQGAIGRVVRPDLQPLKELAFSPLPTLNLIMIHSRDPHQTEVIMRARWHVFTISVLFDAFLAPAVAAQEGPFTLEQVMSAPFPSA